MISQLSFDTEDRSNCWWKFSFCHYRIKLYFKTCDQNCDLAIACQTTNCDVTLEGLEYCSHVVWTVIMVLLSFLMAVFFIIIYFVWHIPLRNTVCCRDVMKCRQS